MPANIKITSDDRTMLVDFGIAKILTNEETQTLTGTGIGISTPENISPEKGRVTEVDEQADIYFRN